MCDPDVAHGTIQPTNVIRIIHCLGRRQDFDETAEGRARPGHFRGVATIVTKLFQIVRPDRAYFGQKDVTQCVLMRRLVQDLNMDIEICIVDTVREADGLAMSSRNAYLDARDRRAAPIVYKSLQAAQALYNKTAAATADDGTRARIDPARLRETVVSMLRSEWMVTEIQYVAVDDPETMRPIIIMLDELELFRTGAIISVACFIGNVRLIDNILLLPSP